ncbi:MAG: hypothetical protein HWE22_07800 [Flavobacteriales bacterium]|nr:hypothetical protein [Flavobacteriales bacterium]
MKKSTGIKFTALLMLFMGITLFSNASAQTTTWKFVAGDNSGFLIQIKTVGSDQEVSEINLAKVGDTGWTRTDIQNSDYYESYFRVKSSKSGRVYELNVDWYNGKVIMTLPEGNKVTYWLKES